uniref:BTB domain-containing protein n=1 Tax=Caenorhabditis tropicalis TaxID=1561998 RepID=A0A1I7TCJ6_9PELO
MACDMETVKLNVGGTIFQTRRVTLTRMPSSFIEYPLQPDKNGAFFIDRSPKHFEKILNFMRDFDVDLPNSQQEIQEILKEAHVFKVERLIKLCEEKLRFRFIENDFHQVQIIKNSEKPVIIIYYKIDQWDMVFGKPMANSDSAEYALEQFQKLFDIYFKPNKDDVTNWSYSIHDNVFNNCSEPQPFNAKDFKNELKSKITSYFDEKKLAHLLY